MILYISFKKVLCSFVNNTQTKKPPRDSVILLTEYHAISIRLRRVLLLRSDIRLTPSDICSASYGANRISLKPQGFNITVAMRQYHSLRQQRITLYTDRKRENVSATTTDLFSLSACNMGLGLALLRLTSQMRCLHFYQSTNSPLRIPPYTLPFCYS